MKDGQVDKTLGDSISKHFSPLIYMCLIVTMKMNLLCYILIESLIFPQSQTSCVCTFA